MSETLRKALEEMRTAMRTDPGDRFWEGYDAAIVTVEVAMCTPAMTPMPRTVADDDGTRLYDGGGAVIEQGRRPKGQWADHRHSAHGPADCRACRLLARAYAAEETP